MEVIEELGDDLVLRRATVADTEALVAFNGGDSPAAGRGIQRLHRRLDPGPDGRRPPDLRPGDFTVVEATRSGDIVSSLNLIAQTWTYGGIPFGVGRVELVGTRPDYRRRGLVRRQMDVVHQWSAERGHLVQAITGIPHYYRQFGYEMALDLGGGRAGYPPQVPELAAETTEPYQVRPATPRGPPVHRGPG